MKKYNNFINESNFLEFLKKGFKNTITLAQKEQQDKISSLINKINTSDSFKNSILILTTFFRSNINKNFDSLDNMKKLINDDLISVDIALKTLSKKYGNDLLLPKNFFSESNNNLLKKCFIQEYEKNFIQNLPLSVKSISEQLMQNAGINIVNEDNEIQHLQNTDKLDSDENIPDENADNTEEKTTEKSDKEKNQLIKIKKSFQDFQRNSLYEPIINQLEEISKEQQKQDPNKF